jgi:putative PIN family toxin of toxin-antitoxin system
MPLPHWVIDTNVLVSAAITPNGVCDQVLQSAIAGMFVPAWDNKILSEYREVLSRPKFKLSKTAVRALLEALPSSGFHPAKLLAEIELPDLDDLPFVAVALATPDKTIITGNPSHYPESVMKKIGVEILSPRQAVERLGR